ncbi:MAG: hypothetical protein ABIH66_03715 [bacterium]
MSGKDGDIINLFEDYPEEILREFQDDIISWLEETAKKENIPVRRLIRLLLEDQRKKTGTN